MSAYIARRYAADAVALALLATCTLLVFGLGSSRLGFYADDAAFLSSISPSMELSELWAAIQRYVTGRNLHILWQYLVFIVAGGNSLEHLPALHAIQASFVALNVGLVYVLLRLWGTSLPASFMAAALFAFFANHGETHYWLSSMPMNVASTLFVLTLGIAALMLVKRANAEARVHWGWLLVAAASFFCSMFTYDQAVPLCMTIVFAASLRLVYHPKSRRVGVVCISTSIAVFLGLLAWKIAAPGGGPTFAHLSIAHVLATFVQSVKIWIVTIVTPLRFVGIGKVPGAMEHFHVEHAILSAGIAAVAVLAIWKLLPRVASQVQSGLSQSGIFVSAQRGLPSITLMWAGLAVFILAYLPGYVWFLSPRHSYLPSVGVAMLCAACYDLATPYLERRAIAKAAAVGLTAYVLFASIAANLIEKDQWIVSYELRRKFYESLAEALPSQTKYLLLEGFPRTPFPGFPAQPFLTQEQATAPALFTGNRLSVAEISLHPVPSASGYFIRTEIPRYGNDELRHIAAGDAALVTFKGMDKRNVRMRYSLDDKLESHAFYRVVPLDPKATSLAPPGDAYVLSLPQKDIQKGEVPAAVGYRNSGKPGPGLYWSPADAESLSIPIDLSVANAQPGRAVQIRYSIDMATVEFFRLYAVGESEARSIGDIHIER